MRKLGVFNQVSLDGYFAGTHGDISWAKANQDPEFQAFAAENAKGGGALIFGRVTYEMMAAFWSTPQAYELNPTVAERMNNLPKIVFSRTLDTVSWSNTRLVIGDPAAEVRKLKKEPGKDMAILGSGSIASQLAREGLIDEYQFVVNPVVLGEGRAMLEGLERRLNLKLTNTRTFGNGNVFLCYQPMT
jgi:dihydrofolate reductase